MIGRTISHYKILQKLGEGGMGVVYKAQDLTLDRPVALKFLPHQLSPTDQDKARFLQEAKAAAALNHPNICTIYALEEADGEQIIVMEYVDGQTLRTLKSSSLSMETIISSATQIAEGLQAAHSKGIVHRDIKADNIMVNSSGQIRVMDFGLAKLKGALKLTKVSSTVGTVGYMAPEQIQVGEADVRSDVFAFGVLFFEMLAGRLPFRGEHEAALLYSILNEEPESIRQYRPEISVGVEALLARAMEKNPEDRYQSMADLLSDLRRVQRKSSGLSRIQSAATSETQSRSTLGQAGQRSTAGNRTKLLWGGVLVIVLVATVAGYFLFFKHEEPLTSLAVMPFVNATGDQSLEYLADGVTESIISNLSRLSNLRVMSRSSVFRYKGKEIDPQEVGKTLGVRAVLTGRMTQRPDGFSISFELIDTKDNRQIWGDHYLRSLASMSSLETDIPREVTGHLKIEQSGEEREKLNKASTNNPEAYALYLKGRFNWNKRLPEALHRAVDFFSQAIEKDPTYALAYTGLAETYVVMPVYIYPPPKDAFQQAKYYAMKALELNPRQAEAYTALGNAKWSELDFAGAESDLKRAIELNPRYATAHHWYALVLSTSGRYSEAISEAQKAIDLDPLSLIIQTSYAVALQSAGKYNEAIEVQMRVLQTEPAFPIARIGLWMSYIQSGKPADALAEAEKVKETLGDIMLPNIASSYALLGRSSEARAIVKVLEATWKKGERVEGSIAMVYLALGEKEKAVEWLDKVFEAKYMNIVQLYSLRDLPKLSHIDADPKIQASIRRIGLR